MVEEWQLGSGRGLDPHEKSETADAELLKKLELGIGLAVASMTLGLVGIGLSIFVIGAGAGLVGVILAIIHLSNILPFKGIAITGLVLSIIGTVVGAGFGVLYGYSSYKMAMQFGESQFEQYYGTEAPELELTTIDGKEIKLSQLKGKRVMLDFWATWCGPCKKEIPHIIELRKQISEDKLVIIGISNEPEEKIRQFAEKEKINYSLIAVNPDDQLPEPFDSVTSIPTTFFIDANGVIESTLTGYQSLETLQEYALGLEPVIVEELIEDSED